MRIVALISAAIALVTPAASFAEPKYVVVQNTSDSLMQVKASVPYSGEVVAILPLAPGESQQVLCGELSGVTLSVMRAGEADWTVAYPTACAGEPAAYDTAKLR